MLTLFITVLPIHLSSSKNSKKTLDSCCFVASLWLFMFEKWCSRTGALSINHRHGFADSDPDPDPYKNVTDSQHWYFIRKKYLETVSNGDEILLHLGEVDSLLLLLLPQLQHTPPPDNKCSPCTDSFGSSDSLQWHLIPRNYSFIELLLSVMEIY